MSHEATHGITNRMTGGGTASCLQATESGGMGEGWSDTMADWLENDSKIDDFILGTTALSSTAFLDVSWYFRPVCNKHHWGIPDVPVLTLHDDQPAHLQQPSDLVRGSRYVLSLTYTLSTPIHSV